MLDLLFAFSGCSGSAVRSFESLGCYNCSIVRPVGSVGQWSLELLGLFVLFSGCSVVRPVKVSSRLGRSVVKPVVRVQWSFE